MAWKRWKRASSTAAGSAEALSSSWHVTLPIGLQLPKWWLAGFHKIWLEIRNLLLGHLEPEEVTWPLVLAFWQGLSKTLRHASGTRREVAARTNRCVCSSVRLYRLLKQFADLPRLDFWRLVKQIKSQMSLFRIFPPPLCRTSYRWVVLFSPVEPQCSRSKTTSRPCTLSATGVVASARTYVSPASPSPTPSALSPMGKCQNTQHGRPKAQRRTPQLLMISS